MEEQPRILTKEEIESRLNSIREEKKELQNKLHSKEYLGETDIFVEKLEQLDKEQEDLKDQLLRNS
jgi:predicted mannosyl-3-phosphoglycerate phosphatase (HAD superfamily)